MAENLLANRQEPLHNEEIGNFLSKSIAPMLDFKDNTYIKQKISDLVVLRNEAVRLEKEAYKRLRVADLDHLQDKLDQLNKAGLDFLGNKVIKSMPAYAQTQGYITAEAVSERLNEEFQKYMDDKGETIIGKSVEEIGKNIGDYLYESGDKRRRNIVEDIDAATGKILFSFSSAQRRELGKFYGLKKTSATVMDNKAEITIELGGRKVLNYYPYFDLSEEEKAIARQDYETWQRFKKAVQDCITDTGYIRHIVGEMMDHMGLDAFLDSGGSSNDVLGIFGELQGMIILRYLTGEKKKQQFLGHVLDEKNRKIGVDLALNEIGFQVKNYNTLKTSGGEVFNLSGNYTLKNFLNVIDVKFGNEDKTTELNNFYTISAYHTIAKKRTSFSTTRLEIDRMEKELPQLYHGAIAEMLPLKEIGLSDGKTTRNVFYLVGGHRILPVSAILTMYINYLDKLSNLGSEDVKKMLTVRKDYDGDTYKNYMKNHASFNGYNTIAKNIKMHFNVRTNIDRAIQEVLRDESFEI